MFSHLLIPIDINRPHQQLLKTGHDLAYALRASATVFHSSPAIEAMENLRHFQDNPAQVLSVKKALLEQAYNLISHEVSSWQKDVGFDIQVDPKRPEDAILDVIKRTDVDVVLMETHQRTSLGEKILGGITERVIARTDLPIFLIRPDLPHAAQIPPTTVMLPVDFLDGSDAMEPWAFRAAKDLAAERLIFYHVIDLDLAALTSPSFPLPELSAFNLSKNLEEGLKKLQIDRERILNQHAKKLSSENLTVDAIVEAADSVDPQSIGRQIVHMAQREQVDLIVLPTRRLKNAEHWILGSVSEYVTRHSPCMTLVLKGP